MKFTPAVLALAILSPTQDKPETAIGDGAAEYARLFRQMRTNLERTRRVHTLAGQDRLSFSTWMRDHIHVMKAEKYLAPEMKNYLEFYLDRQTPEGLYYDYHMKIDAREGHRMNLFHPRFWKLYPREKIQMHRLPVEADLEYLAVEGVWYAWQATGDRDLLRKRLPGLEKGLRYLMSDPLRWSSTFLLVKRGYTIDTWDFQQLPTTRAEYVKQGFDVQKGIFDIDEKTPMGIMHGDNSGLYAACRQLAAMHRELGQDDDARIWDAQADVVRLRANRICWNGKFYAHFVPDGPPPPFLKVDQSKMLSLSNPYDVNRGMATEEMAQSIVATYLELKESMKNESFAEWFSLQPPVEPHYADHEAGTYVNGGVLTIVAGELAKAAFQHGYEAYGADILRRLSKLVDAHQGKLPCTFKRDGTPDRGIPDNWGEAAIAAAMIEGLAGVVDRGALFRSIEVSPRWIAAGVASTDVTVAYGAGGKQVRYTFTHDAARKHIQLALNGDAKAATVRMLLPDGVTKGTATVDGSPVASRLEKVRNSVYVVVEPASLPATVAVTY
jgi:hypothetical protein